jgi:hypothetical protein
LQQLHKHATIAAFGALSLLRPRAFLPPAREKIYMEATVLRIAKHALMLIGVAALTVSLAGCASQSSGRVPVGFASGGDCQSVRGELRKLDGMGVPSQIQARTAGQRMSSDVNARIDRYNYLLEEYLGNNCQLPPGH